MVAARVDKAPNPRVVELCSHSFLGYRCAIVGTLLAIQGFGMQAPSVENERESYSAAQLAARLMLSMGLLLAASVSLSHWLKPELERVSREFYENFGVWGAALGTWLADGFNFPVPPQAYMLLAEAHGAVRQVLPAIVLGSLAGGVSGYLVAPILTRIVWISAFIERTQPRVRKFYDRGWIVASLLLSLSPIAFSWLCYCAALYRLPRRALGLLCLLRIPKLMAYQQLISWGWS